MAVNKVVYNAKVLLDLTSDTVTPETLAEGVTAHDKSGNKITGTMATNVKIYELTLAKASGWVLLTTLDDEVMAHINDKNLKVSLSPIGDYTYVYYAVTMAFASNEPVGMQASYHAYGVHNRVNNETLVSTYPIFYSANDTSKDTGLGNGRFRLSGSKYYFRPHDGFLGSGTYRLTFTW